MLRMLNRVVLVVAVLQQLVVAVLQQQVCEWVFGFSACIYALLVLTSYF